MSLSLNFLSDAPFPIPGWLDVVSHPRTACKNKLSLHMSGPSRSFVALLFHMWGFFVFFLDSIQRNSLHVSSEG